ncbi:MAG: ElyC/SanA/YdcF family protein [Desulfobaccales bacterium]
MFILKKIAANFLSPGSLGLEILILGLFLLWFTRRQRLGKIVVSLGTALLLLFGSPLLSPRLLMPLERHYPALLHPEALVREGRQPQTSPIWIVVLGGGHDTDPSLPVNSQISRAALSRVVEGVRLYRALPGSKLLMSGGVVFDPVSEAGVMARIAQILGVKPQDLVLEETSRDTAEEAAIIAKMIGADRVILVTSAAHMPRAMALFEKRGLNPIPAPTDYLTRSPQGLSPGQFFPGAGGLGQAEAALHEYLGLAWAWLRGDI